MNSREFFKTAHGLAVTTELDSGVERPGYNAVPAIPGDNAITRSQEGIKTMAKLTVAERDNLSVQDWQAALFLSSVFRFLAHSKELECLQPRVQEQDLRVNIRVMVSTLDEMLARHGLSIEEFISGM